MFRNLGNNSVDNAFSIIILLLLVNLKSIEVILKVTSLCVVNFFIAIVKHGSSHTASP